MLTKLLLASKRNHLFAESRDGLLEGTPAKVEALVSVYQL